MNYIELINRFWRIDESLSQGFSPSETRLYFYLLKIANTALWPDQFDIKDSKLCGNVGLSPNTLKPARMKLVEVGLLTVELSAPGLREGTTYQLISEEKASGKASIKQSKKPSKIDAFEENEEGKRQENNQNNRQNNHQKLTLFYIYNDIKPKTETVNNILFVAYRDDATVRKCWFWLLQNKKKEKPPSSARPPNIPFEVWWEAYDKRIDKKACEPKWNRLTDEQRQQALTHTGRYVLETPNPKYRKNPETYLNRESWNNEPLRYEPEPDRQQPQRAYQRPVAPAHASPAERAGKVAALFSRIDKRTGNVGGG